MFYQPPGGSAKQEDELAQAIKKALTPEESAPKQKHVRACILYTWDVKGPGSFFYALKTFPMLSDEVISFKALLTYHKVIRQGHPNALKDQYQDSGLLDQIATSVFGNSTYSQLTHMYIDFLRAKLNYHRAHPAFSGTFDYEEYVTLMGVEDPNEGYETIFELMGLLDRIEALQKAIFSNLRSYGNSEARISALVPLVEESFGIYQFIVSMMAAMHTIIGSVEVLEPLRDSFNSNHYRLARFYEDCMNIRFLTSLIQVPKLSAEPPNFMANGPPKQKPRNEKRNNQDMEREKEKREQERLRQLREEQEQQRLLEQQMEQQRLLEQQMEQQRLQDQQLEQQRLYEQQQRDMLLQQQREMERLRLQQQQQEQFGLGQQVEYLRQQSTRDRQTLNEYEQKFAQMQQQLAQMNLQAQNSNTQTAAVQKLAEEIDQWKQKYEALAKLYAQLRKEHLDLLQKFKTMKDANLKVSEDARKRIEQVQNEMKVKGNELTEVLVERNRLKGDADRIRLQYEGDLSRMRQELEQSKQALNDMSLTRGSEVQSLVARFTVEQTKLEDLLNAKQKEVNLLTTQLGDVISAMEKAKMEQEEERAILQASLDQALEILRQHQEQSESGMMTRDERIGQLEAKHQQLLYQMMDNVLDTCITTVSDQLFQLDQPDDSKSMAPEFVLLLIEKTNQQCADLSSSLVKLVNGGDPKDAITHSSALAQTIAHLLQNGRGMERLTQDDDEEIISFLKQGGQATVNFFQQVKSASMVFVEVQKRPEHIVNLARETQMQVGKLTPILEKIVGSKLQGKLQGDLADAVAREMSQAAKAIEEASKRLHDIMARQGPNLNVHSAILQAAVAITTAIANLIRCATESQQEIASQNKGTSSTTQFYKKNNKWTEGLISAAQSVATATVYLVEVADGLVAGTHSWEQLVVAAQEVGVSTTQLVAAARVKATLYSKTQDRLEQAAVAVREATKLLMKAAKDASKLSAEKEARDTVGKMSKHEAKVKEMEQQVRILELEKLLNTARYTLGEMRKAGYHEEN